MPEAAIESPDTFAAQMERAKKRAAEAEAAGKIPAAYIDSEAKDGEDEAEAAPGSAESAPGSEPGEGEKKPEAKADPKKAAAKKKDAEEGEPDEKSAGAVTPADRAAFRAEKRKWYEKREEERSTFRAEVQKAEERFAPALKAEAAIKAGDVQAACEAICGKPWNDIQKAVIQRLKGADPRVEQALSEAAEAKRLLQEREERDQQERDQQERARERQAWMKGLSRELGESEEPLIAALAKSSLGFLDDVFAVQEREYDPVSGETMSPAEAAAEALPRWQSLYEELQTVFGDRDASNPEAIRKNGANRNGSDSAKPGAKASKTLSQRKASEVSPRDDDLDEKAWSRRWSRRLKDSSPE